MTLPATGPISLGAIRTELGASGPISLGSPAVRTLLGLGSGTISMNAGHGKSNGLVTGTTGYSMGGQIGGLATNEITGLVFANEAATNPSQGLISARQLPAGINSSTRGYAMGGLDDSGTSHDVVDGMQFDNLAAITTSAWLSVARYGLAGANSSTVGYAMYGQGYNTFEGSAVWPMNGLDGMGFSTETILALNAFLSSGYYAPSAFNSTSRAYVMCSNSMDGPTNKTIALNFATDTAFDIAATMALDRYLSTGVNSITRGYNLGGYSGGGTGWIDGLRFDTEASISPSVALSSPRYMCVGVNSNTRAYALGGEGSSEIDGLQFDTETAINPAATLPFAQGGGAGVQAGQG